MKNGINKKLAQIQQEIDNEIQMYIPDMSHEEKILLNICPAYIKDLALNYDIIISGGMITSIFCKREVNDIDIYLKKDEDVYPFVMEVLQNSSLLVITDRSIVTKINGIAVNIILFKTFNSSMDIFNSFDFTVCMGAYDFSDKKFHFHKDFF